MLFFYKSLMHKFYDDAAQRMKVVDNYNFVDFTQRMLIDIEQNSGKSKFNVVCENAYEGHDTCAYNIARAFGQAYDYLNQNVSSRPADWKWSNVHANEYANIPWSKTPLKYMFHREVPTFGNTNTPHVSKVSYRMASDSMKFTSTHVAGYKQIIAHGETG